MTRQSQIVIGAELHDRSTVVQHFRALGTGQDREGSKEGLLVESREFVVDVLSPASHCAGSDAGLHVVFCWLERGMGPVRSWLASGPQLCLPRRPDVPRGTKAAQGTSSRFPTSPPAIGCSTWNKKAVLPNAAWIRIEEPAQSLASPLSARKHHYAQAFLPTSTTSPRPGA